MAFLKFLLMYGLFVTMITLSTNEDSYFGINISKNDYLPDHIVPIHYTITLVPFYRNLILEEKLKDDLNTIVITGLMNASIYITRKTEYIALHFSEHINVTYIQLVQTYKENNITKRYNCSVFIHNHTTNVYVLQLQDEVPQGYYNLYIKYQLDAHNNEGLFITSYTNKEGEKEWLLATQFQPIGARQIFPCWDEPRFRTTFELSIMHNSSFTILSNNLPQTKTTNYVNSTKSLTYINSSSKLSTHLVAFAMIKRDDFSRHFGSDTFGMYCRDDIKQHVTFAWNVAKNITDYLKNKWELLKTVNHVIIPRFPDDGISNLGLIYYTETAVIYDKKLHTLAHKMKVADLVARLTVNQWFGNIVIPLSWPHLWLVKSLATLLAIDTIDEIKIFQNNEMKYLFIEQIQYESLHLDLLQYNTSDKNLINFNVLFADVESPSDLKSHFSLPYYRGVCVLRMLQHIITNKIFRIGINTYLHTYGHIPVTSNNFWRNLYAAINFTYPSFDLDIKNIMDSWVMLWRSPVIKVTQNMERYGVIITAEPVDFVFSLPEVSHLWIPITYTTRKEHNFTKTSFQDIIWLKNKPYKIYTEEYDWVIVNLQQTGNYRVNYDDSLWRYISDYLDPYYENIHVLNRAKLIDDAFHFMISQQLASSNFWDVTLYLQLETNYVAWYPMFKAMEYMSKTFPYSGSRISHVKRRLSFLLYPLVKKIRINPNNLTECLWRETARWICIFDEYLCERTFESLKQNQLLKTDSDQWMYYCSKLNWANDLWPDVLRANITNSVSQVSESSVCSKDTALITSLLLRIQPEGDIQITGQTRIKIFFSVIRRHAEKHKILDFLLFNFTQVLPRNVHETVSLIYIINNLYSQENLNKVENFTEYFMEQHTERLRINVKQKIKSRLRDIEKHMNYIQIIALDNHYLKQKKYD